MCSLYWAWTSIALRSVNACAWVSAIIAHFISASTSITSYLVLSLAIFEKTRMGFVVAVFSGTTFGSASSKLLVLVHVGVIVVVAASIWRTSNTRKNV